MEFPGGRNLLAGLKRVYTDENNFADLKIQTKDNMLVSAHKLILAARSPILKVLIEKHSLKANFNNELELPSVNAKPFLSILHWMYTDELSPECGKFLSEIVESAKDFELTGLLELVDENMINFCKPNNMLELFRIAEKHKLNVALPQIAAYIKTNIDNLIPLPVVRRQSTQLVPGPQSSCQAGEVVPSSGGYGPVSANENMRRDDGESSWSRGFQYFIWIFIAWIAFSIFATNVRPK